MADYVKKFGLSEDPFTGKPSPTLYFPSESHNEALLSLQYGIREKKGFMLLLGDRGMGKTTLVQHLAETSGEKVRVVFIPHSEIPFEELLAGILEQLDIPSQQGSKGSMLRQLNHNLIERLEADETVVLVLDEAHTIDESLVEEVRLLANLETSKSKLLQLILCGEPELRNKLHSDLIRQIGQRIVITSHIKPLTRAESLRYIDHHLELVGASRSGLFTEGAARVLCKLAGGVPLAIDVMCSNSLSLACSLGRDKVTASMVRGISREKSILADHSPKWRTRRMYWLPPRKVSVVVAGCLIPALLLFLGRDYAQPFLEHITARNYNAAVVPEKDVKWEAHLETSLAEENEVTVPQSSLDGPAPVVEQSLEILSDVETDAEIDMRTAEPAIESFESHRDSPSPQAMVEIVEPDRKPEIKIVIEARSGDSLSSLALRHYGMYNTTIIDCILDLNPSITNPDLIFLHQRIILPEITKNLMIRQEDGGTFMVHLATFTSVALADRYRRSALQEDIPVKTETRRVSPVATWHRIMAGPYAEWQEAVQALDEMRNRGLLAAFYGDTER